MFEVLVSLPDEDPSLGVETSCHMNKTTYIWVGSECEYTYWQFTKRGGKCWWFGSSGGKYCWFCCVAFDSMHGRTWDARSPVLEANWLTCMPDNRRRAWHSCMNTVGLCTRLQRCSRMKTLTLIISSGTCGNVRCAQALGCLTEHYCRWRKCHLTWSQICTQ